MLVNLLKYGFLIVSFLALALWLKLSESIITVNLANYTVTTNIFNLMLTILFVYWPYKILKAIFKGFSSKINTSSYTRNLIRLEKIAQKSRLNSGELLKEVIESKSSVREIKKLTHFLKILSASGVANAKFYTLQTKIDKALIHIYYKALILEYLEDSDVENFKFFSQRGINLEYNGWFVNKLILFYIQKNQPEELLAYKKSFKNLKFQDENLKIQTYCLINHNVATYYYSQGNYPEATKISSEIIDHCNTFLPSYTLLLNINTIQQNKDALQDLLETMWHYNKNYYAIELWLRFNTIKNYATLVEKINSKFKKENLDMNKLLLAALASDLGKYLEANELLSTVKEKNTLKDILALKLSEKEHNMKGIGSNIDILIKHLTERDMWGLNYVKP